MYDDEPLAPFFVKQFEFFKQFPPHAWFGYAEEALDDLPYEKGQK